MKGSRLQLFESVNIGGVSNHNHMIELSPHHFKSKENTNFFNMFTALSKNYIQND